METPLLLDWLVKDEEAKRIRLARNPTGRFGKPEEIVNMAVYLASPAASYVTGAILACDGGQMLTGGGALSPDAFSAAQGSQS